MLGGPQGVIPEIIARLQEFRFAWWMGRFPGCSKLARIGKQVVFVQHNPHSPPEDIRSRGVYPMPSHGLDDFQREHSKIDV